MGPVILKEVSYVGDDALEVYLKYLKPAVFLNISQDSLEINIKDYKGFRWETDSLNKTMARSQGVIKTAVSIDMIRRHFGDKPYRAGVAPISAKEVDDDLIMKKLPDDF